MKKQLLLTLTIMLYASILLAQQPMDEINKWASQQPKEVNTDDVVNFMNGNGGRAPGDITFGNEYVFNSSDAQDITILYLDANHFLIVYMDTQNSYYGTCVMGTISGNAISYGSKFLFNSDWTFSISAIRLDETHHVVAFRDGGNSFYGTAVVGTVSGSTITYGSKYIFNNDDNEFISLTNMDGNHFVVAYHDNGHFFYGTAVVGSVTDNAISFGSEFVFNSSATSYVSISNISASQFVVSFKDDDNSGNGTSMVGTISGNAISYGSKYIFNSGNTDDISTTNLNTTSVIIAYMDWGNGRNGTAIIGNVSGETISFGSEYVFNSVDTDYISVALLDNTQIAISYSDRDIDYNRFGSVILGTFSGNEITYKSEYIFNPGRSIWTSIVGMGNNNFAIAYTDWGNNFYGTAIVGEIESQPAPSVPLQNWAIIFAITMIILALLRKLF